MEKERKVQIIKAAVKRFTKYGLNKTTLEEIARDLRIGKATIYHYFESKEDLYFTVLKWRTDEYIDEIKKIFEVNELPIEEKFLVYLAYKENIWNHFQLIYELILRILADIGNEKEISALNYIITSEENIIAAILNSESNKKENIRRNHASFIVNLSWGLVFSSRINSLSKADNNADIKDNLLRYINFLKD